MRILNQDVTHKQNDRMEKKVILCIAGILLLFVVVIGAGGKAPGTIVQVPQETVPKESVVVEEFYNVYIKNLS